MKPEPKLMQLIENIPAVPAITAEVTVATIAPWEVGESIALVN